MQENLIFFLLPAMKHWKTYIDRQNPAFMQSLPVSGFAADLAVVIPCFDEPDLAVTLQSLCECSVSDAKTLVLVIINSGVRASEAAILQNRKTCEEVLRFAERNNSAMLHFLPLIFELLPRKHAGVGLARKIGMDLAVRYFYEARRPEGIIVSLDADCTVSPNFLSTLPQAYRTWRGVCCTVQNFEHRISPSEAFLEPAIRQYEQYIAYFGKMLQWVGFPYFLHTIGSAFSVTAEAYVRAGGMGRQQGGEDFYFLHKVFPLGKSLFLADTCVYPMARVSERIPFGTGPALRKIVDTPDGQMQVYSVEAFVALKKLFDLIPLFYEAVEIAALFDGLPYPVRAFTAQFRVEEEIEDCRRNSASIITFRKRFFHHFNAFKVIKYLNFVHTNGFHLDTIGRAWEKSRDLL